MYIFKYEMHVLKYKNVKNKNVPFIFKYVNLNVLKSILLFSLLCCKFALLANHFNFSDKLTPDILNYALQ